MIERRRCKDRLYSFSELCFILCIFHNREISHEHFGSRARLNYQRIERNLVVYNVK